LEEEIKREWREVRRTQWQIQDTEEKEEAGDRSQSNRIWWGVVKSPFLQYPETFMIPSITSLLKKSLEKNSLFIDVMGLDNTLRKEKEKI